MGNVLDLTNGSLWAGQNNEQRYGDDNSSVIPKYGVNQNNRTNRRNQFANLDFEKLYLDYINNQPKSSGRIIPVTLPDVTGTGTGFDFSSFVANNKWLLIGVVGIAAYMFFSGGLGASDRTVTSVTRYSPKARK